MKKVIVIGSGAGGATIAKELQGKFNVTIIEEGIDFKPFTFNLKMFENLRKTGLLFDERFIQIPFPVIRIRKTEDKMVLVNGVTLGGTTTISTGNARRMDNDLKKIGINLDREFSELYAEIPVKTDHQKKWRDITKTLFEICEKMGLDPMPTPKMGNYENCTGCGRCILGCTQDVKWDSRKFLKIAFDNGSNVIKGCRVLNLSNDLVRKRIKVTGVYAKSGLYTKFYPAEIIVLAAGGFGTPQILLNSKINFEPRLFVDPVLCVAAEYRECRQFQEVQMPFIVQKEHFILSPYFDYISFFFNRKWKLPSKDIISLMIKLADTPEGTISQKKISKKLSELDKKRMDYGINICKDILYNLGLKKERMFLGTVNAGHPGGMLPLTVREAESFHNKNLPENLYIADATLFPCSLGNPPILTIMAIAKRVSKIISDKYL